MKKTIIILLTVILVFCACLSSNAQIPPTKTLVYPQTWVQPSGKGQFRIITNNDSIAHKITFVIGVIRYTAAQRQDRNGYYWERSFYFQNYNWNNVVRFIDSLKKY